MDVDLLFAEAEEEEEDDEDEEDLLREGMEKIVLLFLVLSGFW